MSKSSNISDFINLSFDEREKIKIDLMSSLIYFTKFFYLIRHNREFIIKDPMGRRSHYLIIAEALEEVLLLKTTRLRIEAPPRYGKTELLISFVAWSLLFNSASNFIYTSYGSELAVKSTSEILNFIQNPIYQYLFDIKLDDRLQQKHHFKTKAGGEIFGVGAGGGITGRGAGIFGSTEYAGSIIVDDIYKPGEALSDTISDSRNRWYYSTLANRVNDNQTSIIINNQRTGEKDLSGYLEKDTSFKCVTLKALDDAGNALCPEKHTREQLLEMKRLEPWVFATQYQQSPMPDGGAIFEREWFNYLPEDPDIVFTFVTADTAETVKTYNDATAMSFFGLYKIARINKWALHWIDCIEVRVKPKHLKKTFLDFWDDCMRYKVPPSRALIENKSTGVTLISELEDEQGIRVDKIERNTASGSKGKRFIDCELVVAEKRVTFTEGAKHAKMCIDHCIKLTPNDTHRFDDIGDTLADAIKHALIDNMFKYHIENHDKNRTIMQEVLAASRQNLQNRRRALRGHF